MKWIDVLRQSPSTKISVPDDDFTYGELATKALALRNEGPLFWKPEWSRDSLGSLLAALDSDWSVVVDTGKSSELKLTEKGLFYISSSGTEGPSRYIAHDKKELMTFSPLYEETKAAALLKPGHAAGIEFFLSGLKGRNQLFISASARDLSGRESSILHGPPALLGYLLSFPSLYGSFLKSLSVFYNGTEALPETIALKANMSGYHFSIHQVYGTTETWSIKTETHPDKPWLMKFTDERVRLQSGKVLIGDWFTGDEWKEVLPGWGKLESQRHWISSLMGEKINLIDLESEMLKIPGVVDAQAVSTVTSFGHALKMKIFALPSDHQLLKLKLASVHYEIEFHTPEEIRFAKKKRKEESV